MPLYLALINISLSKEKKVTTINNKYKILLLYYKKCNYY